MARERLLKPSFFLNEELARLAPITRLFFAGLWCEADREGRLEDRPERLKAKVLPYDQANGETMVRELAESGFVQRYVVDGQRLLQVRTFGKHQRPHPKEAQSVFPPPCDAKKPRKVSGEQVESRLLAAEIPSESSLSSLSSESSRSYSPQTPRLQRVASEQVQFALATWKTVFGETAAFSPASERVFDGLGLSLDEIERAIRGYCDALVARQKKAAAKWTERTGRVNGATPLEMGLPMPKLEGCFRNAAYARRHIALAGPLDSPVLNRNAH
jgi:hypothetical protein